MIIDPCKISTPGPQFEVITDGIGRFLQLEEAGIAWDNGHARVELGKTMLPDGSTHPMTAEEASAIQEVADSYSASK